MFSPIESAEVRWRVNRCVTYLFLRVDMGKAQQAITLYVRD